MRVTATILRRTALLTAMCFLTVGTLYGQTKRTYTVRAGDTLYRIAVNHKMSVTQLQELNGITGTIIKVGQVLRLTDGPAEETPAVLPPVEAPVTVVDSLEVPLEAEAEADPVGSEVLTETPIPPPAPPLEARPAPAPEDPTAGLALTPTSIVAVRDSAGIVLYGSYQPAPGQTFFDLAFALGVPVDTLAKLNPDHANVLSDGGPIRVPARFASSSYQVVAGDTLYKIAADHGVSLGELRLANQGLGDALRIGQQINIPSSDSPAEPIVPLVIAEGPASVYPDRFQGRLMASGKAYDETKHTIAHPALPFGTIVMIENGDTGARTFAEVADRMPVSTDFVVEVSKAVSEAVQLGSSPVRVRIIHSNN